MKKVKKEDGAGLQDWLSYQSRTREPIQSVKPETDIIDWDEGIEVQEEWLPRELCEQRLREEAGRKLAPAAQASPAASAAQTTPARADVVTLSATVEIEDVPLAAPAMLTEQSKIKESAPVSNVLDFVGNAEPSKLGVIVEASRPRSKAPTPTQFEPDDLVSAVPAFDR